MTGLGAMWGSRAWFLLLAIVGRSWGAEGDEPEARLLLFKVRAELCLHCIPSVQ